MDDAEVDTILAAHRPSTQKQFAVAWKKLQKWIPPDLSRLRKRHILAFLNQLGSLKPHTVECYKTSLTFPLKEVFNIDCTNQDFKLLCRGRFNRNPPTPKRVPQWSLNDALETIKDPKSSKSIKHFVFLRALFLTALATVNRASEIAHLVRDPIALEGRVNLHTKEGFIRKNQTIHKSPKGIAFETLGNKHPLCPAKAIKEYLTSTAHVNHENYLFVHPISGKPLTGGRLNYWLAKAIKTFDSSQISSSHDMRKVSSSLAFFRGVDISEILSNGFWSSKNVFIKNYLVHVDIPASNCIAARRFIRLE